MQYSTMKYFQLAIILITLVLAVDLLYCGLRYSKKRNISFTVLINAAIFSYLSNYSLWHASVYVREHGLDKNPLLTGLNLCNAGMFILMLVLYLLKKSKKES